MVVDDKHDLTLFYRMALEYYGFEVGMMDAQVIVS